MPFRSEVDEFQLHASSMNSCTTTVAVRTRIWLLVLSSTFVQPVLLVDLHVVSARSSRDERALRVRVPRYLPVLVLNTYETRAHLR